MEIKQMKAQTRKEITKPALKECRRKGYIPAIIYSGGGENVPLALEQKEWTKLFNEFGSGNLILDLIIDGSDGEPELIKVGDVQWHPFESRVLHVDFVRLARGVEAEFEVPISLIGKSEGEKAGGVLSKHLDYIVVRCIPSNVPESIEVDISNYELNSKMHVKDIVYESDDVQIASDEDELIFTIEIPKLVLEPTEASTEEVEEGEEGAEAEETDEKKDKKEKE